MTFDLPFISTNNSSPVKNHLVVLIHGVNGKGTDFDYIATEIKLTANDTLDVQQPLCNQGVSHDGIKICAERYLHWIQNYIELNPHIDSISFIGHSLGGIYARCLVGLLHHHQIIPKVLTPIYFIALSAPHITPDWHMGKTLNAKALKLIIGQSGKDLATTDAIGSDNDPILLELSKPHYTNVLLLFTKIMTYANIRSDPVVEYGNANLTRYHYCNHKAKLKFKDVKLPYVFEHEDPIELIPQHQINSIQDEMLNNLMCLPWTRYAIIPSRPILAHADMIVRFKKHSLKHGKRIVEHIASHFEPHILEHNDSASTMNTDSNLSDYRNSTGVAIPSQILGRNLDNFRSHSCDSYRTNNTFF
ncbi:putative serine esterase-domain-containing protein [Globomyces pollinis-pini]|nr:putative serine esterase-domain-containing protein [Globomyces pollinis-pini]